MSRDTAAFLAGSEDRLALLSSLRERSAAPATLADDLSLPRRSVQRHLSAFVDRGWARKDGGTYRLTTVGELVAEEHASYLETLSLVERFAPFYEHFPSDEPAPDPRALRDAECVVATDADPQAPVHHYVTSVRSFGGDRIRMLSPVLSRLFHDAHADLAFDGVHTDLVMSGDRIDRARELNPAEFGVVVRVGVLDLYRHPDPVEFGLTLGENRVLVGAYDDGRLRAVVDSTAPDLLRWAAERFEDYRRRSERVDPSPSLPFGER